MSDSPTATQIIRKKTGNFLEDFRPGQIFRHKGGKTITEGLFTTFTEFSMSTHPTAKNARYARAYGFEGLVCPPGLVMRSRRADRISASSTSSRQPERISVTPAKRSSRPGSARSRFIRGTNQSRSKVSMSRRTRSNAISGFQLITPTQSSRNSLIFRAPTAISKTWNPAPESNIREVEPSPTNTSP